MEAEYNCGMKEGTCIEYYPGGEKIKFKGIYDGTRGIKEIHIQNGKRI